MSASADNISRRAVLAGGAALVVGFSLLPAMRLRSAQSDGLPGSLERAPLLDAWMRIDDHGKVTVFTGKAELGQGMKTALRQIAAEELRVAPQSIELITADTERTANEGYTAGSHTIMDSGTAILHAAAQVRAILLSAAAQKWSIPEARLQADDGFVVGDNGKRIGYGELVAQRLHVNASASSNLTPPQSYRHIGKSLPRVDIPAKVSGDSAYVHDMRLPGMVHARVVRPPSYGARLQEIDTTKVEHMPGVVKVVRDGSFLAVAAEREYQAVSAMTALAAAAKWEGSAPLPERRDLFTHLLQQPAQTSTILERGTVAADSQRAFEATFRRNYQMHGSIGPSCAVAQSKDGVMTVWTHTQGVFPLRGAIAKMLGVEEERVHCIHTEGSGCYGHNGADDVAADAALIAAALPGRPVRVQWMREQEHTWEPYGSAMVTKVRATVQDGRVSSWQYDVWSSTHSTRPSGNPGNLLAARHLAKPHQQPPPRSIPLPDGGGDRNAIPLYTFANARVVHHFIPAMPLRVSSLRSLGAYMNVFATESSMEELAVQAGIDPVEFRLRHLDDARARAVVEAAADKFGWARRSRAEGRGCGFAYARYKNQSTYVAMAVEASVDRSTGRIQLLRAVAAVDCGQAVNPDGIRNQIEGGFIQAASWTLLEAVAFNRNGITSRDWSTYPILRFSAAPQSVDVHIIDRPGQPFLGAGEGAQGPAAAAIGNAVAAAAGRRILELPLQAALTTAFSGSS
ncbi:MAG TPA: molybdopterin cofactor-binding domain-containing protein [Steroidobacteraceae bacterium]|nr:molybdopterin cofactor-binding domain-containing protein [Steroidobacteraceae bacterium]